jgi:hypothetical protein
MYPRVPIVDVALVLKELRLGLGLGLKLGLELGLGLGLGFGLGFGFGFGFGLGLRSSSAPGLWGIGASKGIGAWARNGVGALVHAGHWGTGPLLGHSVAP